MNKTRLIIIMLGLLALSVFLNFFSKDREEVKSEKVASKISDIDITYPKGGEQLESGQTYKVSWEGGGEQMAVTLTFQPSPVDENALTLTKTSGLIKNTGSYDLAIPVDLSGSYSINLLDEKNNQVTSDAFNIILTRNPDLKLWDKHTPPAFSDFPAEMSEEELALLISQSSLPDKNRRGLEHKENSRLFVVNPKLKSVDDSPTTKISWDLYAPVQYYLWDNENFLLIYQEECTFLKKHICR